MAFCGLRDGDVDTHVGTLPFLRVLQDVPEDLDGGFWLDGNPGLHPLVVDVADQLSGARPARGRFIGWFGGCDGGDGRFIMKAVEITPGGFKVLDPSLWLFTLLFFLCRRVGSACPFLI